MPGSLVTRADARNERTALLQVICGLTAVEYQRGVEEAEEHDRRGVERHIDRLSRRQCRSNVAQPARTVTGTDPADHGSGQQDDGRSEDRGNHASHVQLERQVRRLTAIHLVAHLTACVIHQDLALSALDEHHEVGHEDHQGDDEDRRQGSHRTSANQFEQATDSTGETRSDTGKDQDRDTVAQATFGDLLTQPHQEHRTGDQGHDGGQAEAETRVDHQALRAFQCHGNAERLEDGKTHGADAGVLRDLALASFAFLLHLLKSGQYIAHELHDDGSRDVGHDPQREHGETRQRSAREHVEQVQDAALLALEELGQLVGVDTWHRDMSPDAVDDQCQQQEYESTTEVAELACLREGCSVSGHEQFRLKPD